MVAWSSAVAALALFVARSSAQSVSVLAGVRVDDSKAYTDANRDGIQFSSGWGMDDTDSKHYRGTYTSTTTAGSYMMLSFSGTSIGYYADKAPDSGVAILALDGRPFNATWRDQNVTTTVQRQQQMWMAVGLPEGDHQLVLGTVPSYMNSTGRVGLDYFSIIPVSDSSSVTPTQLGPGASVVPPNAIIVDNEDPAIEYDSTWKLFVNYGPFGPQFSGPTPLYFNNTQRSSLHPGATATFTFTGTDVWYFCDDYWGNANVSISVDGGEGEIIDTSTPAISWVSQKMWWSKTGLSPRKHTVTVTHVGLRTEYANVDFFMYMPSGESATHGLSKVMIGTIVGAVVAGVVVLLGLIILGVFIYRRKKSTTTAEEKPTRTPIRTSAAMAADSKKEEPIHMVVLPHRGSEDTLATLDEKTDVKEVV
ncbi:hypothetical protein FRC12_006348 [Ceratobasidium sp. 428]|nr:hypothetical protein FRC12_006348 [Ceratobasidium sp. 428]